ncbi:MAG: PilN domain-containing protein [Sedimentisphaerales bacterium]|jgi:hypothetical protein
MKEIDFLPNWYRTGQKRQVNYRTQWIVLSGVFAVMVVWSLVTTRSISSAKAELAQMTAQRQQAESASAELAAVTGELQQLQGKIRSIERIDSKIDVASVLAELSFLIDDAVVLSRVEFTAEKPTSGGSAEPSSASSAVVRAAQKRSGKAKDVPLGNVRFKVVIAGVAADASDVAALISRLEESLYFQQVVLAFSRDAQVGNENATSFRDADVAGQRPEAGPRTPKAERTLRVSEFQINCYLGNYREL